MACEDLTSFNEKKEVLLHEGDGLMSTEEWTKCKNAVCMIYFKTRCPQTGKPAVKRGSGFYAKAKVFGIDFCCIITDHHVIGCEEEARGATVIFHYDKKNQGAQVQLKPDKLFRTNPQLDYTVIGVNDEELYQLNPRVVPIEYVEQPQAMVGDDIFIFQHPLGQPKQFSYEKISKIEETFVHYMADTDEGSSGSPVLWRFHLYAVHVTGNKEDGYNRGTLFSAIINDLHTGSNISSFNDVNLKRDYSSIIRNSPKEMEENSCKRINLGNWDNGETSTRDNAMLDKRSLQSPDNKMLNKLSQECCGFYKKLGRELEVKEEKIVEISIDHVNYGSPSEKCYQVLLEWKKSDPENVTNEVLEKALRSLDKNTLANKYFR